MPIGRPLDLTANVATKVISATATASQTQFTVTGGYRINQLGVFRNGVRLVDGVDFTATDGSIVTLLTHSAESDTLAFQIFDSFNVANTIKPNESDQTITGDLNVTGDITYDEVTGRNLNITGVSTFAGRMNVNSSALFNEGLSVTAGVTTIAGTSTFAKKTTVNATLEATEGLNVTAGVTTLAQLTTVSSQLNVGSNIKAGSAGVVTATSFVGSGADLTGVSSWDSYDSWLYN